MILESIYNPNSQRTSIKKYWREEESGDRKTEVVGDFNPYIYIPADFDIEKIKDKYLDASNLPYEPFWSGDNAGRYILGVSDETFEAYDGHDVRKLELKNTKVVKPIRNLLEEYYIGDCDPHYEADVTFDNRYMIDRMETPMEKKPMRTQYMDIEVSDAVFDANGDIVYKEDGEMKRRMPDVEEARQPVLSIAMYDSATEEYEVIAYKDDVDTGDANYTEEKKDDYILKVFKSEAEMLAYYLDRVELKDFDVISGWNLNRFDFKYLCSRLETLKEKESIHKKLKRNLDYSKLSPQGDVWIRDEYISIKGRELFDLYKAYRTLQWGEQESYRLGDVAEREIGIDKIQMEKGFHEMYQDDFETFIDYNKRDVELTVKLDEEMGIQDFWDEVRRICKCSLEEILISMRQVDNYILDYMSGDVVLPSKSTDTEQGDEATGGAVFDAPTGVVEDVSVMDLSSLYPNLIRTFNISPETIDKENGDIDVPDMDVKIRADKEGILPQVFGELFDKRNAYKKEMKEAPEDSREEALYDMRQGAVKIVMNCFHEDTWIKTPDGSKEITEIQEGDIVYSINPETGELEEKRVKETTEQYNQFEELIVMSQRLKGDYSEMTLKMTPHHRMVVRKGLTEEIEIMEAEEVVQLCEKGEVLYVPVYDVKGKEQRFIWTPIYENSFYRTEHKKNVYCLNVEDNQTVVAGDRTHYIGTGQTIYGVSLNPYFRLYNFDVGRSITKMGRETIEWSSKVAEEEGYETVYGDSVIGSTPIACKIDGEKTARKIEELWELQEDHNIEVWSDKGWTKAKKVIRKPMENTNGLKRIETDKGTVTVTKDHSLLDKEGEEIHADDVLWGDELLHRDPEPLVNTDRTLDNLNKDIAWMEGAMFHSGATMLGQRVFGRCMIAEKDVAKKLKQIFEFNYDVKVFITEKKERNGYSLRIADKDGYDKDIKKLVRRWEKCVFDENGTDQIPDYIWNASSEMQKAFIDGYRATVKREDTLLQAEGKGLQIWILARECDYPVKMKIVHYKSSAIEDVDQVPYSDEVKEVRDMGLSRFGDYVYDIETENHHFHAGIGSLIVHNTDSIFVHKEGASIKQINDLVNKVDESYREFITQVGVPLDRDNHLEMEFEKHYRRLFFAGVKKRYAGKKTYSDKHDSIYLELNDGRTATVNPDVEVGGKKVEDIEVGEEIKGEGKVVYKERLPVGKPEKAKTDITGFETVRSDNSEYAREVQREVLEMIVEGKSRTEIIDYVKKKKDAVKNGNVALDKVAIPKGIGKKLGNYKSKPPAIRGAIYSNRHFNTDFSKDDKARVLYVTRTGTYPATDVVCINEPSDLPDEVVVNWKKMADKSVNEVVEQIFTAMDWEISSLDGQQSLGDVL